MKKTTDFTPAYAPLSQRAGPAGDTTITTFNLYNLFEVVQRPLGPGPAQALATKIRKLVLALRYELLLPDVLVVQEVESEGLLQRVGDAVNEAAGTAYRALSPPCSDPRGIRVGFLWDEGRVTLADAYQLAGTAVTAAFGPESPSPGREPLVGVFQLKGKALTIVANHLKSDYTGDAEGREQKRLLQAAVAQRRAQARVVRDFVNEQLAADGEALLMVAGDLNQAPPAPPAPSDPSGPLAILSGGAEEVPLTNLLLARPGRGNYTFIREGVPVILDHILVSPGLMQYFAGSDVLHFNTTQPDVYENDPTIPWRVSDHDPLEARFSFAAGSA